MNHILVFDWDFKQSEADWPIGLTLCTRILRVSARCHAPGKGIIEWSQWWFFNALIRQYFLEVGGIGGAPLNCHNV